MKKIAIFQYDLGMGGIQKSLCNLLQMIDYDKYQVDLYLFTNECFFEQQIPDQVHVTYLKAYMKWCKVVPFSLLYRLKQTTIKTSYDVAIDFNSYAMECAIHCLKCSSKKHVIWCHNDVYQKYQDEWKYRILWSMFRGKYRYFDQVVAVSTGAKQGFLQKLSYPEGQVVVIPNLIDTKEIMVKKEVPISFTVDSKYYNLITVGRFCKQKGLDLLLATMRDVVKERTDIRLYLVGDGPERSKLEQLVTQYQLENYVIFLGKQANPYPYMAQMDGFVLTSRYEGQGMVLWEAKALGLELFFPKRLERYNPELVGCRKLVASLVAAKRKPKKETMLTDYNQQIIEQFTQLMEG